MPVQDGDLVVQGENLDVLVPIAQGQQPQRAKAFVTGKWARRRSTTDHHAARLLLRVVGARARHAASTWP
ncbi:hypothetical protein ACFLIM_25085 [Nonomuraea sp. M3C6]|uniref:Uncharacterized protein n=1 Tax=Nonomuraea marmarensis TaxID=3351344 RepID=A0ABW7AGH7_9ACTN